MITKICLYNFSLLYSFIFLTSHHFQECFFFCSCTISLLLDVTAKSPEALKSEKCFRECIACIWTSCQIGLSKLHSWLEYWAMILWSLVQKSVQIVAYHMPVAAWPWFSTVTLSQSQAMCCNVTFLLSYPHLSCCFLSHHSVPAASLRRPYTQSPCTLCTLNIRLWPCPVL